MMAGHRGLVPYSLYFLEIFHDFKKPLHVAHFYDVSGFYHFPSPQGKWGKSYYYHLTDGGEGGAGT